MRPPNTSSTPGPQRVLRRSKVLEIRGDSTATLYADMAEGRFPRPIRTGKRSVAWLESDVLAWQQARIAERDARLAAEAKAKAKADAFADEVLDADVVRDTGGGEDESEPEAA
jgi:prophage regulatory protein